MELIKRAPNRLYNCDETGITIVQHKHRTVVGIKGKRQIYVFQGAERGCLITVFTCSSPAGHYIPPLIIFPRKNMKMELTPGSIYASSLWVDSDGSLHTVVPPLHPARKTYWRGPGHTCAWWTQFTYQELRCHKFGQRSSCRCTLSPPAFDSQDAATWFQLHVAF
jgi:hypothetical protein